MAAETLAVIRCAVYFADIELTLSLEVEFFPGGCKLFAMSTPWRVEFDKPSLILDRSVELWVDHKMVEVARTENDWFIIHWLGSDLGITHSHRLEHGSEKECR